MKPGHNPKAEYRYRLLKKCDELGMSAERLDTFVTPMAGKPDFIKEIIAWYLLHKLSKESKHS